MEKRQVLIVGDTHGNYEYFRDAVLSVAREYQIDTIVQLGDFGHWPLTKDGRDFEAGISWHLDELSKELGKDCTVIWIDGNHDDHKALAELQPRSDGFVEITDRILWAPRGQRWEWEDVRFLALGGAYSIDRQFRKLNSGRFGWFLEEVLTQAQADLAKAGGPCDVLLTHDAPESTIPLLMPHSMVLQGGWRPQEATVTPKLIQQVADATRPKLLLHGHWHHSYEKTVAVGGVIGSKPDPTDCRVVGLACDDLPMSMALLELPTLEVTVLATGAKPRMSQPESMPAGPIDADLTSRKEAIAKLTPVTLGNDGTAYPMSEVNRVLSKRQQRKLHRWLVGQTVVVDAVHGDCIWAHDLERWANGLGVVD